MTEQPKQLAFPRAYSWLGLPLAFVGLPLYLYLPKYFTETYALDVALVGLVLLALRLADMVVDPLLGYFSDRHAAARRLFITAAAPLAALAYAGLFWPAVININPLIAFSVLTAILYISYSVLVINYYALGIGLAPDEDEHIKLATSREGKVLVGTLLAALAPALLQQFGLPMLQALQITAVFFAVFLLFALLRLRSIPQSFYQQTLAAKPVPVTWRGFSSLVRQQRGLLLLFLLFFINALPVAITSTLFLFYADDVLQQEQQAGFYLTVYFLAAAMAAPLWGRLIARYGQHHALVAAMLFAIISFVWAYFLTPATAGYFYVICFFSGLALAADMIILPALLAQALAGQQQFASLGFAFWQALSKWSLALAAGLMLPALGWLGYTTGGLNNGPLVAALYALLPCLLKVLALLLVLLHARLFKGKNDHA